MKPTIGLPTLEPMTVLVLQHYFFTFSGCTIIKFEAVWANDKVSELILSASV